MVYDWDTHQETCYQLYIEEGRSLEDIMDHMKTVHKFAPSKRAFQTQFRRWNFPSKQRPAYKNDRLVSRIKELWEKNLAQREMLRVLNEEDGFDIKPRELMRVRTRHRWLLRVPNGDKSRAVDPDDTVELLEDASSVLLDEDPAVFLQPIHHSISEPSPENQPDIADLAASPEKPDEKKRKRNRLTTDASGAIMRFPSEMTIDEARLILTLDLVTYRNLRLTFQHICHEESVVKKTVAGPEEWEASKARLIRAISELQNVLWASKDNPDLKKLALDVICTDVTKRMRTMETRMTLAEAKNTLGVNPQESREIRIAFHRVLCDARFTCKSDATPKQWDDLKGRWGERSELIKRILDGGEGGPDTQKKARALEVLARDVMKRLRDDRVRKDPKHHQLIQSRSAAVPSSGEPDMENDTTHHGYSTPVISQMDQGHNTPATGQMGQAFSPQWPTHQEYSSPSATGPMSNMPPSHFDDISEVSHASQSTFGSPDDRALAPHVPMPPQSQASGFSDPEGAMPQQSRVVGSSSTPHPGMQLDSQMGSSSLPEAAFLHQSNVPQYRSPVPQHPVQHHLTQMEELARMLQQPVPPVQQPAQPGQPPVRPPVAYIVSVRIVQPTKATTWMTATMHSCLLQDIHRLATCGFPGTICTRIEGLARERSGRMLRLPIEQQYHFDAYLLYVQGVRPAFEVFLDWGQPVRV